MVHRILLILLVYSFVIQGPLVAFASGVSSFDTGHTIKQVTYAGVGSRDEYTFLS